MAAATIPVTVPQTVSALKARAEPIPAIQFKGEPVFRRAVTERVEAHLAANSLSARDLPLMYLKTAMMFAWWGGSYALLILAGLPWWANILFCISFGLAAAGVGFNVMHDANHEGYSRSSKRNRILGWSVELLGFSSFIWRQQHNIWHHTYTNISGLDEGLEAEGLMRWSPYDPWKPFFRWQHIYWPVLYALSAGTLMLVRNFKVYFTGVSGPTFIYPKMTGEDRVVFWTGRLVNLAMLALIPLLFFSWLEVLAGFALALLTAGLVMATILQLSHVMAVVRFPEPAGDPPQIPGEWAVHQVESTIDFAPRNALLSWYIGGLNYQIEHHLFPRMCHLNYPKIAPIVRQVCLEHGVTYISFPTFRQALAEHVRSLRWLGQPDLSA